MTDRTRKQCWKCDAPLPPNSRFYICASCEQERERRKQATGGAVRIDPKTKKPITREESGDRKVVIR